MGRDSQPLPEAREASYEHVSMTKYLVERVGVGPMVALLPGIKTGSWEEELGRAAGVPLSELRRQWLATLRLTER